MPGRNPAEAVREYIEPLQQSLSCLSPCIIRPSAYDPGEVLTVTLSEPTAELITVRDEILHLYFNQRFSIIEPKWPFRFKVKTHEYIYALENACRTEILSFHWHPEGNSPVHYPHLHIRHGAGVNRAEIGGIHFRTDRIAFEEFCLMLLDHFDVVMERPDAKDVLAQNLARFKSHKTW